MSDFSAARMHLERAYVCLNGTDETSRNAREAIDLLIEAIATKVLQELDSKVITFPNATPENAKLLRTWWCR